MKIKIYGAGSAFKDFMALLNDKITVVACFSSNPVSKIMLNVPVLSNFDEFVKIPSDYVILALRDVATAREKLLKLGVDKDKIISFYNSGDSDLVQNIQEDTKKLNNLLNLEIRLPAISNMWLHSQLQYRFDNFDWVRNQTFELVSDQIKQRKLMGDCAELGVYRGDQASIISKLFPKKTLYLFDTFEGFSKSDLELEEGRFSDSSTTDFTDTSLDLVLSKIVNPERCIIKRGYFPETAKGLDAIFCFVSLDVDLYAPTLAGLKYFYPRLEKGGAIFVHDYNNIRYKGVKEAVDEFIIENECPVLPIPDSAGSIIILK